MEIRKAKYEDLPRLKFLLSQLTYVGNVNDLSTNEIKNILNNVYVYIVVESTEENVIAGMGTLILENKLIHNGSAVGHIEDVVVDEKYRKKGIGRSIIEHLINKSKEYGCYKVILDCSFENVGFYEKIGFRQNGYCMRFDI